MVLWIETQECIRIINKLFETRLSNNYNGLITSNDPTDQPGKQLSTVVIVELVVINTPPTILSESKSTDLPRNSAVFRQLLLADLVQCKTSLHRSHEH